MKATKDSSPNEHASHSASEETDIEVDEEADCITTDFEVGEKLGAVNGRQLLNALISTTTDLSTTRSSLTAAARS